MENQNIWQLQNAKNKLSQLINIACEGTPQLITKNGNPAVYVIKANDIKLHTENLSIKTTILNCPHKGFLIPEDRDTGREINL